MHCVLDVKALKSVTPASRRGLPVFDGDGFRRKAGMTWIFIYQKCWRS